MLQELHCGLSPQLTRCVAKIEQDSTFDTTATASQLQTLCQGPPRAENARKKEGPLNSCGKKKSEPTASRVPALRTLQPMVEQKNSTPSTPPERR